MGGGTFSTFLLDCNLEQFLDYIQYVFNCPGNPHTLVDHLQPPTPVKKSDIETLARMNAILTEANKKVRRRKEAEEILSEILTNSSPQELDKYDASPRNPLPISGIRRKTQPDVSQEFVQELLNEPPQPTPDFHPGDTVEVIDRLHSAYGRIGVVHYDQELRMAPSLVVVQLAGPNTHTLHNFRKDQIQLHTPQESDSCNGNGKAQSTGE
jgi:transcription antitermination factor NusG